MTELLTPILNQDLRNPNFFNGRLLTATDLRDEQTVHRAQRARLGQAIGAGVVHGLHVEQGPIKGGAQTVVVHQGLALNANGQTLALKQDIELALTPGQDVTSTGAGLFVDCAQPASDTLLPTTGIHILTISPASAFAEQAPMRDFSDGSVSGCGDRYAVEGVQFRRVELNAAAMPGVARSDQQLDVSFDARALSQLRNLLAHYCFSTLTLNDYAREPFLTVGGQSAYVSRGAIDLLLAGQKLTECDVPLALLYWSQNTLRFVDIWSVRRNTVAPSVDQLWPLLVGERRPAEADATFLQFQDHLEQLRTSTTRRDLLQARNHFRFLPAAGYLPLGVAGFNADNFFVGLDTTSATFNPAFLRLRLQQSFWVDPIDLQQARTPILLYRDAGDKDYLLFVRAEESRIIVDPGPDDSPRPPVFDQPGRVNVDLVVRDADRAVIALEAAERNSVRESERSAALFLKDRTELVLDKEFDRGADILVWAEDIIRPGRRYPGRFVKSGFSSFGAGDKISLRRGVARYVIDPLPSGTYRINAQVTGFQNASQTKPVGSDQTVLTTFNLVPKTVKPGGKPKPPKDYVDVRWREPGIYEKLVVFEKAIDWPWPPEPPIEKWPYHDPRVNPLPADADLDLIQMAEWVAATHPEAPLDPGNVRLHVDPTYDPGTVSKTPYAYLVFGDGGVYMPVALTLADRTLARPVAVGKGNLSGVDRALEEQLTAAGVKSVDVLAALWTDLLGEELGFSQDAAGNLIDNAVGKVDVAQEGSLHDSLFLFPGVDATVAEELAGAGVANAIDLANRTPAELVEALGTGSKVDIGFAQRLVGDARAVVSPDLWSLNSAGLSPDASRALRDSGVETLGMLNELAERDPSGDAVREVLPDATDEQVEGFRGLVDSAKTQRRTERKAASLLVSTGGGDLVLSPDETAELSKAGILTVGGLARSDLNVQTVTRALGGDATRAATLIASAKGVLGR